MLKFRILLIAVTAMVFVFSSCTKQTEEELLNKANAKIEEAKKFESENKADDAKRVYGEAVDLYKQFVSEFPNSPKAAGVYSGIAKIYVDNLRDYPMAIKYYKDIGDKFPATKDAKYAMFMTAFIYDEMLKDKEKAKESYRKFLEKYPKDEDPNEKMSESAKMMLQMLDENRSIEDIIKNTQTDKKPEDKPKKDSVKIKKLDDGEDPRVPPQKPNDKIKKDNQ